MKRPTKNDLLRKYAGRAPKEFKQVDAFTGWEGDMLDYDNDGIVICGGTNVSLFCGRA